MGNRVAKLVEDEVVEKYLWQNKTTLLAVYDVGNSLKQRFEYTLGHVPTSFTQAGQRFYILTGQVGTPKIISDASGGVIKRIDYYAFGNVISDTNPEFKIPFGFAGGLQDNDTGLVRFGVIDIVDCEIQLLIILFWSAAVFSASVVKIRNIGAS